MWLCKVRAGGRGGAAAELSKWPIKRISVRNGEVVFPADHYLYVQLSRSFSFSCFWMGRDSMITTSQHWRNVGFTGFTLFSFSATKYKYTAYRINGHMVYGQITYIWSIFSWSKVRSFINKIDRIYRVVQKKGTGLLNTSLAWPAVAGCSPAETFSQLCSISFAQPCMVYYLFGQYWLDKTMDHISDMHCIPTKAALSTADVPVTSWDINWYRQIWLCGTWLLRWKNTSESLPSPHVSSESDPSSSDGVLKSGNGDGGRAEV